MMALAVDSVGEPPVVNRLVFGDYLRCTLLWYLRQARHMVEYRLEEPIAMFAVPLLVVRGANDPIAGTEWCRRVRDRAEHGSLVVVPRKRHVVQYTTPWCRGRSGARMAGGCGPEPAASRGGLGRFRGPRTDHDELMSDSVKTAAVIYNPIKVKLDSLREVVSTEADAAGWGETLWFETSVDDVGQEVTRAALREGVDLVVTAAGGDGTIRAVAEAVRDSGTPIALLPSGTGNLLARNLELTLDDVPDSA